MLDYTRITAPFAGVITHRYADTGAMIQAGTASQSQAMPIVRLSQNVRLRLVMPVPESAVSRVRLGSPVAVTVQSLQDGLRQGRTLGRSPRHRNPDDEG
jgi:multidrug resistance efflux pump